MAPASTCSRSGAATPAVALAEEAEVHSVSLRCLKHAVQVPASGRARGRECAGRGSSAAAEHGGDAGAECLVDLLRANEMNVGVDSARL
jgi:hypothetical protein